LLGKARAILRRVRPGAQVGGRFEVERLAGSGGMGAVYRARDLPSGSPIALKVLRTDANADTEQDRERFGREASVLAEVRHPGIVRYVAHGTTDDGHRFLAMEWLDGEDLSQRLARSGLTLLETLTMIERLAEALAEVHARGFVHRDVKPSNIFLPEGDVAHPKLLDFGIARSTAMEVVATHSGVLIGTPGYMAPEQARGERTLDARVDVFALGTVAFECITGRQLFVGQHALAVLAKILFEDVPRLRSLRSDVPSQVDELLARLLAKSRDDRPRDGAEVSRAIAELLPRIEEDIASVPSASHSERAQAITEGEQRLVSVIVASMQPHDPSLSLTLTPEQAVVDEGALRAVVSPYGGRLERVADGSFVVTLGSIATSGGATDQAAQAARCALSMRALLPDARMALATGRGVLAERFLVGEVIDRVAALMRAPFDSMPLTSRARPVRIDDVTAGLLDVRFEVGGDENGLELRAERPQVDAARTLLGKPTPCVGRDRELGTLEAIFAECIGEPKAHVVLVTAPSGVGKSRLRHELLARLSSRSSETPEVLFGRGDPMSAGSPFSMLSKALRATSGIEEGAPLPVRRQRLRARLGRHLPPSELDRVTEFLGEMVGVPFDDDHSPPLRAARQDLVLLGDQYRRAFVDFLSAECTQKPILLVLEDLHWGDLPTIKLVDAALRALDDRPFMVLALARPEMRATFPDPWAGRTITEMRLSELSKKASEKLVKTVLGDRVPEERLARVVAQAAGNALYLEELIRAVGETRSSPTSSSPDALPQTVLAMVQARVERLEPEARRVLRAASVFGEVFWRGGVRTLLGGATHTAQVSEWIDVLLEREVIVRRPTARFAGEDEYAFRHSLMRDAAYAMLTDHDRVLGHRLASQWLEGAGESDAFVLAEHCERGGENERAAEWYRRAAEQALGANDLAAVVARAERGVACGAKGATLAHLALLRADAHKWRGEFVQAEAYAREAMALAEKRSAHWYAASSELVASLDRLGRVEALERVAEELREIPEDPSVRTAHTVAAIRVALHLIGAGRYALADELLATLDRQIAEGLRLDPLVEARVHQARANRAMLDGKLTEYLSENHAAGVAFERLGDQRRALNHRLASADAHLRLGENRAAESLLRDGLVAAERQGLPGLAAWARQNLAASLARQHQLDEAATVEADAVVAFGTQGDRRMEGASRMMLADIFLLQADLPSAERDARKAVDLLAAYPPLQAIALAVLGDVLLARGVVEEALEVAKAAFAITSALEKTEEGDARVRLVHARALIASGDTTNARRAIDEACAILKASAERIGDPAQRATFLTEVPEHARTLALVDAI